MCIVAPMQNEVRVYPTRRGGYVRVIRDAID